MKYLSALCCAIMLVSCGVSDAMESIPDSCIRNTSYRDSIQGRVLQHTGLIPAAIQEVWKAFTTSEGLRSFVAPVAAIDCRIGGIWEACYNPKGVIGDETNIQNEVIAMVPPRILVIRIKRTPPGFSHPEVASQISTVIELTEAGDHLTKVTATMSGWRDTPESKDIYNLFDLGNEYTLRSLYQRFRDGPRKWKQ